MTTGFFFAQSLLYKILPCFRFALNKVWDKESSISKFEIYNFNFGNKSGAAKTSLHTVLGHEIKMLSAKRFIKEHAVYHRTL